MSYKGGRKLKNIPIAIQMYTLRDESERDFAGTLRKVKDLGFDGVEFAGFGGLSVLEVKALIEEIGLQAVACHIPLDELKNNLYQVIEELKTLGCYYAVCPFLMPDSRSEADYKALIQFLDHAGEICCNEGITLCYHNHDFELEKLSDGKLALEAIFDQTRFENLKAELDVYWLTKAGEKPVDWMERYQNRTPLIHLKDMTLDEEGFFAELGTGGVDIESILDHGEKAGVQWWIIEQDASRITPFESIEISINYLKQKLEG
jgi:sugar phosphate isomerase/epimerase